MLSRPYPVQSESLQSFIYRLCRKNGWHYDAFKSHISKQVAPLHSTSEQQRVLIVNYLEDLTRSKKVTGLVDIWAMANKCRSSLDMDRVKVCTSCLQNTDTIPAYWYLKAYLVCDLHKQLMIDTCESCNFRFSHDSFIDMACENCGLELCANSSTTERVDRFSKQVYDVLSTLGNNPVGFKSSLNSVFKLVDSELSVLHSITDALSTQSNGKRDNRRNFSLSELYNRQLQCSIISSSEDAFRSELTVVISRLYNLGYPDLGSIIVPISPYIKNLGCTAIFNSLRAILVNAPNELSDVRVGVKLLEKLFDLQQGSLVAFARAKFSANLIKSQGPPSVYATDVGNLMTCYRARSNS